MLTTEAFPIKYSPSQHACPVELEITTLAVPSAVVLRGVMSTSNETLFHNGMGEGLQQERVDSRGHFDFHDLSKLIEQGSLEQLVLETGVSALGD